MQQKQLGHALQRTLALFLSASFASVHVPIRSVFKGPRSLLHHLTHAPSILTHALSPLLNSCDRQKERAENPTTFIILPPLAQQEEQASSPSNTRTKHTAARVFNPSPPTATMAGREFLAPDAPLWRPELAVRQNPYRYLEHQKGTIGVLKIRLIDGRELDRALLDNSMGSGGGGGGGRGAKISPQVIIRVADEVAKSTVASRNAHPSWRERFTVGLKKGVLQEGAPVLVIFQVIDASSWRSKGKDLGTGSLDILPLLNGSRGSHVMDEWIDLSPGGGALHVVVEYEPVGMEPEVEDVVFFEAFARSPRSLVFPPNEPMVVRVSTFWPGGREGGREGGFIYLLFLILLSTTTTYKAVSGAYLLLGFLTPSTRQAHSPEGAPECRVKVHRQVVFVIERHTFMDAAWHSFMDVGDLVQSIPPVHWAKKQLQPYAKYVQVLARPALTSFSLAYAAARLAMRSGMAAVGGATSTVFGDD